MSTFLKVSVILLCFSSLWQSVESSGRRQEKPLMLLVSFDGFRWDYLHMHNLSNFNYLKSIGSHAEYIYNSFSTVTFPNHWTIVTGLYEESHGIMQNFMYDPLLNEKFSYVASESQTHKWFGQNNITEPIWTTNQKAGDGRRSAAEWVGAGITFDNQEIINIPYNRSKPYKELIDEFIGFYTEDIEPINFAALYFDEPDHTGHLFGPYSSEMTEKLHYINEILGYLIERLKVNDLFDDLNLIITSDHGMDTISNKTAIFLDSYINIDLFEAFGSRACYSLFLKNKSDVDYVYSVLKKVQNIDVFKKKDIPDNLHYKNNVRIGDLIVVTKIGYALYISNQSVNWTVNNGDHGYYNNESTMYPIFIAHGPAFKRNYTISSFNNVDIYPLMCFILGIQPAANNGSLENVLDMLVFKDTVKSLKNNFLLYLSGLFIFMAVMIYTVSMRNKMRLKKRRLVKNKSIGNLESAVFLGSDHDGLLQAA